VTVGVLGVLAGASLPFLIPRFHEYQLRSAAWQVAGDLRLARQRAITTRARYRFAFADSAGGADADSYILQFGVRQGARERWVQEIPAGTGARRRLPGGARIDPGSTPSSRAITFNPNGSVVPTGTLRLRGGSGSLALVAVDQAGRVQVSRP
jgi:Tfp pilus assembly protein FimT